VDATERLEVIAAYGGVLAARRHSVAPESDLPHPRPVIREALATEIERPTRPEYLEALTVGFVQLASFLPAAEAALVQRAEDLLAEAGRLIESGEDGAKERAVALAREIPPEVPDIQRRLQARMADMVQEVTALRGGDPPQAPPDTPA
jgi:hypothetical protein